MIGRQVKICTGFTQSIQILRRKKIKKIYCPMTASKKIFSIIDFKDRFDPSEPLDFCGDLFDPKCKRCAYSDPERRFSTYFSCVYKPLQRVKNSICYNIHST